MSKHDNFPMRIATLKRGQLGIVKNTTTTWGKLKAKLSRCSVDEQHTLEAYAALGQDAKGDLKDQGSYVLGQFKGTKRKREDVTFRSGVALDVDSASLDQMEEFALGLSKLFKYEFFAATSRSHTIMKPKWRIVFPTKELIKPEEFFAVSCILSSMLFDNVPDSMDAVDDVTHRVVQVMYWPSRCKDGEFLFFENEGQLLDHKALLDSYPGWENDEQLPYSPKRGQKAPGRLTPAEDPLLKRGPVGAFCRTYSLEEAMERFIPGTYEFLKDEGRGTKRWKYTKGSGGSGVISYADGHIYSHHGTDPCGDKTSNAFDMVRLHLFGSQDSRDDGNGIKPSQQPSWKSMIAMCKKDPGYARMMQRMGDEDIDATADARFDALDGPAAEAAAKAAAKKAPPAPSPAAAPRPIERPAPPPAALVEDDDWDDELLGPRTLPVVMEPPEAALMTGSLPALISVGTAPVLAEPSIEDHPDYDPILGEISPKAGADGEHMPDYVRTFNEDFSIVMVGAKMRVAEYKHDEQGFTFQTKDDFFNWHENDQVPKPGSNGTWSRAQAWFQHPQSAHYKDVVFDPVWKDPPNAKYKKLNLWTGFALEPDPAGSCELFLRHLREVITSTEEEYNYMLGWLAHMVQKPEEIPAVAVVLKGKKGCGKDTVGEYMKPFLGRMHVTLGNQESLFNNFNKHFEHTLFMQLEETFYAGNRKHDSILKSIVTSTKTFIEPKGLDGYQVKSLLRLLMTSNADQVVVVTEDERRYFMLKVKDTHMQDPAWFVPLYKERDNGGAAALLHFLMNHDISTFNVRKPPVTEELQVQKEYGYRGVEGWWFGCLSDGKLPGLDNLQDGASAGRKTWEETSPRVPVDQVYADYVNWSKHRKSEYEATELSVFGRKLLGIGRGIKRKRIRQSSNEYFWAYFFPPLAECRAEWDLKTNSTRGWDQSEDEIDEDHDDLLG